jgi:hypothetical protein
MSKQSVQKVSLQNQFVMKRKQAQKQVRDQLIAPDIRRGSAVSRDSGTGNKSSMEQGKSCLMATGTEIISNLRFLRKI